MSFYVETDTLDITQKKTLIPTLALMVVSNTMFSTALGETLSTPNSDNPFEVRAQIYARDKTTISAGISGTIKSVRYRPGSRAAKGKTLLTLDCAAHNANHSIAKAKLKAARAKLKSNRDLLTYNSIGPIEVTLSEAEQAAASGELKAAQAHLKYCSITAPYTAVITQRYVHPQQFVNTGDPLLEIYAPDNLEIKAVVSSHWLQWLRAKHTAFEFVVDELGLRYRGTVSRLGGSVDPVSQTVELYGSLEQAPMNATPIKSKNKKQNTRSQNTTLLPGMSGTLYFNGQPVREQPAK